MIVETLLGQEEVVSTRRACRYQDNWPQQQQNPGSFQPPGFHFCKGNAIKTSGSRHFRSCQL